jgi:hypothetical protein
VTVKSHIKHRFAKLRTRRLGGGGERRGDGRADGAGDGETIRGILLGRRTYEQLYAHWPQQAVNPYTERLDRVRRYVASRTLSG